MNFCLNCCSTCSTIREWSTWRLATRVICCSMKLRMFVKQKSRSMHWYPLIRLIPKAVGTNFLPACTLFLRYLQSGDTVPIKCWQTYWYNFQASLTNMSSFTARIGIMGGWSPASVPDRGLWKPVHSTTSKHILSPSRSQSNHRTKWPQSRASWLKCLRIWALNPAEKSENIFIKKKN